MKPRAVYFTGAGVICHAGRGVAALGQYLRHPEIQPAEMRIEELTPAISVPYLPAQFDAKDNRVAHMASAAASDALAGFPETQRRAMPLFLASSTPDLTGCEAEQSAALARNESTITLARPLAGLLASQLAQEFALGGGQYTINTACSSGANALLYAAAAIRRGDCEHALVLGIESPSRVTLAGFNSLLLVSRTRCRPFDAERDGLVLGEAAAAVVLSAAPQGQTLAGLTLLGGATACDSGNATQTDATSVSAVIQAALDDAQTQKIDAIKAHGTGTPGNDRAEAQGIAACFEPHQLPITSLKSALGHTLGACGVLETIAIATCWREGFLPPTLGFQTLDPELAVAPVTDATDLPPGNMLLNYFGFGGNNSALVLARSA